MGIVSKWPIVDWQTIYYNSLTFEPKIISEAGLLGKEIMKDGEYKFNIPGSRGIKHWLKPRVILSVLLDINGKLVRIITTHYTVTDSCTETIQMYEMSLMIKSFIDHSNINIPCILSGDFSIRPVSYSINKISEAMTCHTKDFTDTLSKDHIAKKIDFPKGLAIDHVFSKGFKHIDTKALEIDLSVHKALISSFEI